MNDRPPRRSPRWRRSAPHRRWRLRRPGRPLGVAAGIAAAVAGVLLAVHYAHPPAGPSPAGESALAAETAARAPGVSSSAPPAGSGGGSGSVASASHASSAKPASSPVPSGTSTTPTAAAAASAVPAPFAAMIGNDPGARPQAGLDQAKEVWEILDEGWITRYLAIFAGTAPAKIGPIRSTRIYNDQLAHAMALPLVHAGGSADGLAYIPTWRIENIDAIYGSGPYFWRGASRIAPDNLYTSGTLVAQAERAYGFSAAQVPYPASGKAPAAGTPASALTLTYIQASDYSYSVSWTWDSGAKTWQRSVDGSPDVQQDGQRVQAGTVIVLVVQQAEDPNDNGNTLALQMLWQDGGSAWVLRDGAYYRTTWSLGPSGVPVAGVAAGSGPFWYEVVPSAGDVSLSSAG